MKKAISLIIGTIIVASIAIVGILGVNISYFEEVVYTKEIIIEETEFYQENAFAIWFIIPYSENNTEKDENGKTVFKNEVVYPLAYRILPANATNKNVDFVFGKNDNVSIDKFGRVTFSAPTTVTVSIIARDGSGVKKEVRFVLRKE